MERADISSRLGEPQRDTANTGTLPDPDDLLWRDVTDGTSHEVFYRAWLTLLCRDIDGVASAILVLRSADGGRFAPVALWPDGRRARQHLAEVAERALQTRRAVVEPVGPTTDSDQGARLRFDVAQPIETNGELQGIIAVDVSPRAELDIERVLRQLRWGAAWLELTRLRRDTSHASVVRDRLQTVLDLLASSFGHARFTAAATAFVTAVATRLDADRVALAFGQGGRCRTAALSHSARFSPKSNLVCALERAMDEAADQRALVVWPQPVDWRPQVARAHAEFSRQHGTGTICTAPLLEGDRVLGALTVERPIDRPFDLVTLELLEVLAALSGPVLDRARRDDRWFGVRLADDCRTLLTRLFGQGHLGLKVSTALVAGLAIFMSLASGTFRVAANAALEPVVRQAVVAPFPGYVADAPKRAGDVVPAGVVLAALEDSELRLNRLKWLSQQEQLMLQYAQARAVRNAAAAGILTAQIDQARAEVALLDYQLARTLMKTPFAGIVVTGDLSQSLAAPVERGQVLFEIAPLDSYRVVLQVDERDITYVRTGQRGTLVLTGTPGEPLPFVVDKITPVSTARDGHNHFRVEAKLDRPLDRLRPGMEGVGKVEVGRELYIWIWTRQVVDWVRLQLWTWLP